MRLVAVAILRDKGFEAIEAEQGERGLELARAEHPDLVLLDLTLPGMDGLEVCRRLREFSDAYIRHRQRAGGRARQGRGVQRGGGRLRHEALQPARAVRAHRGMLRRPRTSAVQPGGARTMGAIAVDVDARTVAVAGDEVGLTRTEFDLLASLSERPGGVVARDDLLRRVWGPNWYGDAHVVEVRVLNLRRKLGPAGKQVQTVRGVGFRLVEAA